MAKKPLQRESSYQDLIFDLREKEQEISKIKSQLQQAHNELEDTRRHLMEKKAQCNESEERILDLSADVAKWRMIANKRTSDAGIPPDGQRVTSPAEIDRLRQELSSVRRALSDKEREVRELKDKEEQWRRERENQIPSDHYRVQIQQVQADNNDLVREVNELKRTCDELRQRSRAVPTYNTYELDRIKEENASLKKQLDTLQETNLLVHHQMTGYEEDFKRERRDREEAKNRLDQVKREKEELQALVNQLMGANIRN